MKSNSRGVTERRTRAIVRLEKQLKRGYKPAKGEQDSISELTDSDKARIHKEIAILKSRI